MHGVQAGLLELAFPTGLRLSVFSRCETESRAAGCCQGRCVTCVLDNDAKPCAKQACTATHHTMKRGFVWVLVLSCTLFQLVHCQSTACDSFTTCQACNSDHGGVTCGWCSSTNTCIPVTNGNPLTPCSSGWGRFSADCCGLGDASESACAAAGSWATAACGW